MRTKEKMGLRAAGREHGTVREARMATTRHEQTPKPFLHPSKNNYQEENPGRAENSP